MSWIKLANTFAEDERWLEAGVEAFAVHVSALCYCDRRLTDGEQSTAMARRVALAVDPSVVDDAIKQLVGLGFWQATDSGFRIVGYLDDQFSRDQVTRTQERWKVDKRRRAQHRIGDHTLCKDPKYCPAMRDVPRVESTGGTTVRSRGTTRHDSDSTRPEGSGEEEEAAGRSGAAAPTGRGPEACPHGEPNGLHFVDGKPQCTRCADRVPEGMAVLDQWRDQLAELAPGVDINDISEILDQDSAMGPRDPSAAFDITEAAFRHLDSASENDWSWLYAYAVECVHRGAVARAVEKLKAA